MYLFNLNILELEVTEKCNLNCEYCYLGKNKSNDEMPVSFINKILHEADKIGTKYLIITGGEPTLHSKFQEISKSVSNHHFNTGLLTNGLTAKENLKQIKRFNFVQVSLDSTTGALTKKIIESVLFLKENKQKVSVLCTLGNNNKNQINKLIEFSQQYQIPIGFQRMIPPNNTKSLQKNLFTSKEFKQILQRIYNKALSNELISCEDPLFNLIGAEDFEPEIATLNNFGCIAGKFGALIDVHGKFFPCAKLRISDSNLMEQNLVTAWNNSDLFKTLRDKSKLNTTCKKCKILNICRGCRAHAFAKYKNFLERDPLCFMKIS